MEKIAHLEYDTEYMHALKRIVHRRVMFTVGPQTRGGSE